VEVAPVLLIAEAMDPSMMPCLRVVVDMEAVLAV
jgi:hypothetical protein